MVNDGSQGCCGKIAELLKKIDHFGVTFLFRIDKRDKFGSTTGGFWFLLYILVAIFYIGLTVISYFSGNNFSVTLIDKSVNPAPRLNFGKNNFTFAIRLTFDNETTIDKTGIDKVINYYTNYVNITQSGKVKTPFIGRPCQKEDFYQMSEDALFQRVSISDFICFDNISNYEIFGTFTDQSSAYFEVGTFLNQDAVTANYTDIQRIFTENQFKISMYYIETRYDVSDNDNPIFYSIESIYTYLDLPFFKRNNINYQSFVYNLDKNIFTPNFMNTTYMKLNLREEVSVSMNERNTSKLDDKLNLSKFFIKSINMQKIVKRSYQKIPEVLANISGLLVNLLIVLGIAMTFINIFKAKQHVMNGILKYKENIKDENKGTLTYLSNSFKDPKIIKLIEKNRKETIYKKFGGQDEAIETEITQNKEEKDKDKVFDVEPDVEQGLKERLNSINSTDSEFIKRKRVSNPFNINLSDICCLVFCCRSIKTKQLIYSSSESKFNYYMDLITYMKKMQEIDIIKYLLLDVDTLNLMNFISKPSISLTKSQFETKEYKKFFNTNEDAILMDVQNIDGLKRSYLNIISKPQISYLEKRILELFDLQIKEILN